MAFQILVADENTMFAPEIVKNLGAIPEFKVTVSGDALDAFRKIRAHRYDGILLSDTLPKIRLPQLIAAVRELDNNRNCPLLVLSENCNLWSSELKKQERVHLFQRDQGSMGLVDWLKEWLLSGKKKEVEDLHPPVKVDIRIVSQLVQATVFSLELFGGVSQVRPLPIEAFNKNNRYLDQVHLAGATAIMSSVFAGTIFIAFPESTFLKVAGSVLGEVFTTVDENVRDACGELINIIYGQAKTILVDEMDIDFMKSRPYVLEDRERLRSYHSASSFVVPFESDAGPFYLIVSFESLRATVPRKVSA